MKREVDKARRFLEFKCVRGGGEIPCKAIITTCSNQKPAAIAYTTLLARVLQC
jgi:hypothetical protein